MPPPSQTAGASALLARLIETLVETIEHMLCPAGSKRGEASGCLRALEDP